MVSIDTPSNATKSVRRGEIGERERSLRLARAEDGDADHRWNVR
jgi:hypothetical protein